MKKRALIVDVAKCINCQNCVLATKDEHVGNDFPGYAASQPAGGTEWISIEQHTRGSGSTVDVAYVPRMCNHCDDAPCIKAAGGDGAAYKRPDGIVIIDPVKARGRRDLVDACPYGSISWNEQAQLPQIWIFDAHLLDHGWAQPRCVQVCPTGALEGFHDSDAALSTLAAKQNLEVLRPELGTRPRVFYRNLQRVQRCFIAGNVCGTNAAGLSENLEHAHVELSIRGEPARSAMTNAFGDFKIDGLPAAGGDYALSIRHELYETAHITGTYRESMSLASISMRARASHGRAA